MHARCIAYQTGLIFRTIGLNSERLAIRRAGCGPSLDLPFRGRGRLYLDTQASLRKDARRLLSASGAMLVTVTRTLRLPIALYAP